MCKLDKNLGLIIIKIDIEIILKMCFNIITINFEK